MYRVKDDGFILNALYKYNIYIYKNSRKKIVSIIVCYWLFDGNFNNWKKKETILNERL